MSVVKTQSITWPFVYRAAFCFSLVKTEYEVTMTVSYCFSCGKLRETEGGFCYQCRIDDDLKKKRSTTKRNSDDLLIDLDDGYAEDDRIPVKNG